MAQIVGINTAIVESVHFCKRQYRVSGLYKLGQHFLKRGGIDLKTFVTARNGGQQIKPNVNFFEETIQFKQRHLWRQT